MDGLQIEYIAKNDQFLKKYRSKVVFDFEVPDIIPMNSVYYILLKDGRVKETSQQKIDLGHWVILESLPYKTQTKHRIGYFDPMGFGCNPVIRKKIVATCKRLGLKVFINKSRVQLPVSSVCGPLCSIVSLFRARGYTYEDILKKRLSPNARINAMVVPDIIESLLPKNLKKIARFSLDFV